ncbi:putative membrane protein YphA (DoxX/SURF4 family) [Pseudarthrobacter defluvii]|uniref:DoxX family protein n=1 Tax=Pseudarthrobacter defluvii TaxID=410837 RepID=UPI00278A66F1|nr:DoxX family protein [Pseudarthrobacter defluvii]MDQ0768617.1 putative membrane protein YphA (DoxX/SURF4 family) [Pseudarthrobacter defluvii]
MPFIRTLARPMLASSFVLAGLDKLKNSDDTAQQLSPLLRKAASSLPFQASEKTLARVIGGTQVGAGVLFGLGKFSRLSAGLLTAISLLNTFVEWRSADISSKEGRENRRNQLLKNLSLGGGALLASVDTAGKPGLAWRAEHLAADARRNASDLAADARRTTTTKLNKADKAVRRAVHATGA